jgi:hypothetical protein
MAGERLVVLPVLRLRLDDTRGGRVGDCGRGRGRAPRAWTARSPPPGERARRRVGVRPRGRALRAPQPHPLARPLPARGEPDPPGAPARADGAVPDPLASQLRTVVALNDARYALVPAELRVSRDRAGTARLVLRLALVDARASQARGGTARSHRRRAGRRVLVHRRRGARAARFADLIAAPSGRRSPVHMATTRHAHPGDGIGPEHHRCDARILDAAGADLVYDRQLAGMAPRSARRNPMPDATLDAIRRTRVALKGRSRPPVGEGFRAVNVALRKEFDLYANVRPAHVSSAAAVREGGPRLDRENTEGLYYGAEHYIRIGDDPRAAAESVALITRFGSERDHPLRLRVRGDARAQEGHARAQGEHPQVLRRGSSRRGPGDREGVRRRVEFEEQIVDAWR